MKILGLLLPTLLLAQVADAQLENVQLADAYSSLNIPRASSLLDVFAQLPSCAAKCLVSAIAVSTCDATNATCLCVNTRLEDMATTCMLANCTMVEALTAKNLTSIGCNAPIRDRGGVFKATATALGVVTGVFIIIRFAHRIFIARTAISADDWMALGATIAGAPGTAIDIHGLAANGLGRDIWTLSPDTINRFLMYLYIMETIYYLHVAIIKLTILVFYLRIFPLAQVRRVIWGTIAFTTVYCLVFIFVGIFQCSPISFFWTHWDGLQSGHCLNSNAIPWANAAISILLDFWVLGIPMWQLRKLQLHWKKKVGVGMMFVVGTFVTVVSILRLQSLVTFAASSNPTWDNFEVSNWSTIEINVGIMCSCMPSLRLLLVHFFPRVLGSSTLRYHDRNNYYGNSNNNVGGRGGGTSGLGSEALNSRSENDDFHGHIPLASMKPGKTTVTVMTTHNDGRGSDGTSTAGGSLSDDEHGQERRQNDFPDDGLPGHYSAFPGQKNEVSSTISSGGAEMGKNKRSNSVKGAKSGKGGRVTGHSKTTSSDTRPSSRGAGGGTILYSKSYAVEYNNSDYHDEVRLVPTRGPRADSASKSDLTVASRASESSL